MKATKVLIKALLLTAIISAISAFFIFDLHQHLTLENIKQQQITLEGHLENHRLLIITLFATLYITMAALSLPGATIITLLAGALFGVLWGTVIVSFASTVGATAAFLIARFLFHDSVQKRFSKSLAKINTEFAKDGAFYLFTLRLVPIMPFFLINILMGLTPIRTFTFYWVSQIGMLAATIIYVNAGTQLAQIDSLKGLFSPSLVISLAILGIFPLIAKKIVNIIKAKKHAQMDQTQKV